MRERIERHVTQRTEMLAGVSHDLKTPLTRLKLALAMMPDGEGHAAPNEVAAMRGDIAEMGICWTNIWPLPAARAARSRR